MAPAVHGWPGCRDDERGIPLRLDRAVVLDDQAGGSPDRRGDPRRARTVCVVAQRRRGHGELRASRSTGRCGGAIRPHDRATPRSPSRSEEHTSELQSLMRISYAVFCLKKKTKTLTNKR